MPTETGIGRGTPGIDQGTGTGILPEGVLVRIGPVTGSEGIAADQGDFPAPSWGFPIICASGVLMPAWVRLKASRPSVIAEEWPDHQVCIHFECLSPPLSAI